MPVDEGNAGLHNTCKPAGFREQTASEITHNSVGQGIRIHLTKSHQTLVHVPIAEIPRQVAQKTKRYKK